MNIILFGPPGAGKGTHSVNLAKDLNLYKISTGDLLREEIKNDTVLGKKTKHTVDSGLLVSDEIINDLVAKILSDNNFFNRLIFDGYPRNLYQVKSLDLMMKKYQQKISCVLNLNVDKESISKRILGRQTCSMCGSIFNKHYNPATTKNHSCDSKFLNKRSDDNKKTIINRFENYLDKTLPILNFYSEQKKLRKIDGTRQINQIYDEICSIIVSLET